MGVGGGLEDLESQVWILNPEFRFHNLNFQRRVALAIAVALALVSPLSCLRPITLHHEVVWNHMDSCGFIGVRLKFFAFEETHVNPCGFICISMDSYQF